MKRIQKKAAHHISRGWRTTPAGALNTALYLKPAQQLLQETAADPLIRMAAKEHCARMIAIANTMAKHESLLAPIRPHSTGDLDPTP